MAGPAPWGGILSAAMGAVPVGRPRRASPRRIAVAGLLVLPFAWELLGAVSNLLAWLGLAAVLQQSLTVFAWLVLATGVAIPVVAYLLAVLVARRRSTASLARALVVAFCASEALTLSLLAYFEAVVGSR